ncbi:MAG: sugar ABC transporter permease [Chloroflexota bacterium]|nr:MAG: sugar ABC transporter permease [Chloroflexota bacterium]
MTETAMVQTKSRVKTRRRFNWRQQVTAYLFLAPALIIFALVTWYPTLQTVLFSFQNVGLKGSQGWVGVQNYVRMLGNPDFVTAWKNTFGFVSLSIVLGLLVPVALAIMINEMRRLSQVFQMIIYLPALIPEAVALLVWRLIYHPEGGVLNSLLKLGGIPPQLWLQNPDLAKPAMVVIMTWIGAGGSTLIYLSALREIPTEVIEAAELDGFSPWQRIVHIFMPLLTSRIQLMLVLQIIFVAQVFTQPFILTQGGPAKSTTTPVLEIYNAAFVRSDFGLASAWGVSMLVILSVFAVLSVILRKEEVYK